MRMLRLYVVKYILPTNSIAMILTPTRIVIQRQVIHFRRLLNVGRILFIEPPSFQHLLAIIVVGRDSRDARVGRSDGKVGIVHKVHGEVIVAVLVDGQIVVIAQFGQTVDSELRIGRCRRLGKSRVTCCEKREESQAKQHDDDDDDDTIYDTVLVRKGDEEV